MVEPVSALLLRAAAVDVAACKALDAAPGMADTVIGFHAQQACEKCLKAVLGYARIQYPRSHDLLRLMQLLRQGGMEVPAGTEWIDELTPFAVNARYGLIEGAMLDRQRTLAAIDTLLAWSSQRCACARH